MTFKEFWKRELHVAVHAQSTKFRIKKYILLGVIFSAVYFLFGLQATVTTLVALTVLAFVVHFLFRWKTDAWTKDWGPYKKITLPGE